MGRRTTEQPTYDETYRVEAGYHGYDLRVDNHGTFHAFADTRFQASANSLEALKSKIRKPEQLVAPIPAVKFGDGWYEDEDKVLVVAVYGLSGTGAVLYDTGREKKRARNVDRELFVKDEQRIQRRAALRKQIDKAKEELDDLMHEWPRVDSTYVRERLQATKGK